MNFYYVSIDFHSFLITELYNWIVTSKKTKQIKDMYDCRAL